MVYVTKYTGSVTVYGKDEKIDVENHNGYVYREGDPVCPLCGEKFRVSEDEEGKGTRCESCGAINNDGEWTKTCKICNTEVDKLVGLFVPHMCVDCHKKKRDAQIAAGNICLLCRQPRMDCCC